ncbi:hypothetical protein C7M84_023420 [Penaeus vannamei]|uniref:Receptor ligand binding region domain-containing protein n=1 Tax=Penaeus vannamei TaxID=6689 RepID=A0A3R7PV12_PENVA|nr:hypothetical protein C7M84_023420 [Penaeus vannamei]
MPLRSHPHTDPLPRRPTFLTTRPPGHFRRVVKITCGFSLLLVLYQPPSFTPSSFRLPEDGQDEQLVADDAEGGHLQRWAVRVSAGVIGLLLMAAAGMLLRAVDHRYPASRLWAASSGAKLSIGVLLTDTPLDKDLLRAALRAAREQHSASARLSDIHVKQAQTHGTALGAIDAFKKLWNEGVKIFLIGGENSDILRALCKHIESSGHAGLLVSPEAMVSRDVCPCLVSLSPAQEAVVVVEAGRFLEAKVSHVVPVVTTSEAGQLTHLVEAAEARNLSVTPAVLLDPQHISLAQLKERLAEYPNAGVWISLGSDLPHLFAEMSYLVCGRLVMIHAHAAQRARLLRHPLAREAAEKCGVCSAAWAGSTRVDTSARRRLLDDLQPEDPLFASLAYDITGLALAALTVGRDASLPELRAQLLNHDSLNGVTGSMKDGRRSGWVARLRLVAQRLVGWAVLQDTPWLLEGSTQVASEDEGPWATVQETHAPTHMVTQEEILDIINRGRCNRSARVEVTAHDPLTHRAVTTSWSPAEAPYLLLIPNGSPNGFTIKAWCHERDGIPSIEVGCHGASKHSEALVCAFATMDRGRRVVRSILTKHVFPFRRQQYHRQKAYQEQINRRQDYYQLQGQQHYEQHGQQQGYHEQQQQGYHEQQQPATTATAGYTSSNSRATTSSNSRATTSSSSRATTSSNSRATTSSNSRATTSSNGKVMSISITRTNSISIKIINSHNISNKTTRKTKRNSTNRKRKNRKNRRSKTRPKCKQTVPSAAVLSAKLSRN